MTAIAGDAMGVGPYRYFLCWSQAPHAGAGFLSHGTDQEYSHIPNLEPSRSGMPHRQADTVGA
ncbi:MAG: hypothetical protein GM44_0935 [actinobacterium acAMD-2]|nr:MAG: hypothetical protein GM44_0935 [actinobacterium acAMD-2]